MRILEGKKVASAILEELKNKIASENLKPGLGVILVGHDEASGIYVSLKEKTAQKIGINIDVIRMSEHISAGEILQKINDLNNDPKIHGIIVQLPLPDHLDKIEIIQAIDPKKDVDGFTKENIALFFEGHERFFPVFPKAIIELMKSSSEELPAKEAVIICNSQEFGRTMQVALGKLDIFSEYLFRDNLEESLGKIKKAEIIITACGEPGLLRADMVRDGAIIIDGGITRVDDKVLGDADLESFKERDVYISPVPGGVGPVTIACLLNNVYLASKNL